MKRETRKVLNLTAQRAANALNVLVVEGKIAAKDVTSALRRRESMIADLRQRLADLESGVASGMAQVRKAVARRAPRKKPNLSPKTRAKYRQQGRYLGAVRRLSKADRAKVKAIRGKSGVRAAIVAAKKMAK